MKKKYITLEEVLALRGTDTIFYKETILDKYFKFKEGLVCRFTKDGKMEDIGVYVSDVDKPYIREPEEFKVEKTGRYKTRDGKIAYVAHIKRSRAFGMIESVDALYVWEEDGTPSYGCTFSTTEQDDLVEYVGD